eukprot:jgi/Pico_ML_1/55886/g1503.t1
MMEKKAKKEKEKKLKKLSAEARARASELLQDTAECNKSLDDATRIAEESSGKENQKQMRQQQARKNGTKKPSTEPKRTASHAHAAGNPHPRATSTETPPGRGNHTFGSFIPKQFTSRLEQNEAPRASKKNSLTSYSRVAQRALDNSLRSAMTVE